MTHYLQLTKAAPTQSKPFNFAEKAKNPLAKWGTYVMATNPTRWSNSTLQPVWQSVGAVLLLPLEVNVGGGYHGLRCYVGQTQHGFERLSKGKTLHIPSFSETCSPWTVCTFCVILEQGEIFLFVLMRSTK
jgi:hypothetical protein